MVGGWRACQRLSGSLEKLFLRQNNFGDEGAKALATGVAASGSMATIYLYGNHHRR